MEIPTVVYEGDDKKLKERVWKFKTGTFRIVLFTIVGFIMGHYSYTYVGENFLPMKAVLAIPYKLSEALYVSILGTDAAVRGTEQYYMFTTFTEFFPHSYLATFLAESVTTVLIGGAVYGALAYFTGDRRVFTMQRFLKFAGYWCAAILLCVGLTYGVNAKAVADNEALKGKPVFTLYDREGKPGYVHGSETASLVEDYFCSGLEQADIQRDYEGEVYLGITFSSLRSTVCRVNYEERYLVAEKGTVYHISEEFAQIVKNYAERHLLPDVTAEPGAEIQKKTDEKAQEETDKEVEP